MATPRNIFEVINQNIVTVSDDVHALMSQVSSIQQEVIALRLMFNAPEQPNAHGEDGAAVVSSGQKTE